MASNQVKFGLVGNVWLSYLRECYWCLGEQAKMLLDTLQCEVVPIQRIAYPAKYPLLLFVGKFFLISNSWGVFIRPSTHPSIHHLCVHQSIQSPVYPCIHPSIHIPSTQPPIPPSINHSSNMGLLNTHSGSCRSVCSCSGYLPENWIWLLKVSYWPSLLCCPENILFSVTTWRHHNSQYFSFFMFYYSLRSLLLAIGTAQLSLQSTEKRNEKQVHRQSIYLACSVSPVSPVIAFKSG